MNDIIEGYYKKLKRESDIVIFQAKVARKAAYISILPQIKANSLSEARFNSDIWPIDEEKKEDAEYAKERILKVQEGVKKFNLKLSEARRKKANKK